MCQWCLVSSQFYSCVFSADLAFELDVTLFSWYKPLPLPHVNVDWNMIHMRKAVRSVSKQGHCQPCFHSGHRVCINLYYFVMLCPDKSAHWSQVTAVKRRRWDFVCNCFVLNSFPLDGKDKAVEVGTMPELVTLLNDDDTDVRAQAAGAVMTYVKDYLT